MAANSTNDVAFIEPRLKYSRVQNYAKEVISKDSISCIALHSKFIIVGTEWGHIYILDHLGNPSSKVAINAHSTTINQISIDSSGEYIASCSNDGKVMIFGLMDGKPCQVINLNQEIKAIAISPDFKRTPQFVTGDKRLLFVSKTILSSYKQKILLENKSLIRNIKWSNDIIVYATDDSVFVYDLREQKLIGIIDPLKSTTVSNNTEFYCRIFWINSSKFLIGWAHLVQICIIKDNPNYGAPLKSLEFAGVKKIVPNSKKVESLFSFCIPELILGIVPFDKYVLTLTDPINGSEEPEEGSRPQTLVMILEPDNSTPDGYTPLSYERIALKDYNTSKSRKIHLDKIPFENGFYITSSKDLILVKEREIDDRIEFLIQGQYFDKALDLVQNTDPNLIKYKYKDVGILYIEHLLHVKNFTKVAEICQSILSDDKELWEKFVENCVRSGCIEIMLPNIPCTEAFKLSKSIYTLILENQFSRNLSSFLKQLQTWPPTLYNISSIIDYITTKPDHEKSIEQYNDKSSKSIKIKESIILECLGILYEHNQNYVMSLNCYFQLKNSYVFQLITKRKMFEFVTDKLVFLFNYDKDKTLAMLMEYINDIPPETICKILSPTPIQLFHYLNTLASHNMLASEPYHMQMVTLYAEFKAESLLSFLKCSDKYDLNAAIKLCESKKFTKEVIYLLGRIGQSKKALQMIMDQDNSVFEAIDYCLERNDVDLREQLIKYSLDKPDYIKAILENLGMDIDVANFIRRINTGTLIPGLKDSLVTLLINYEKRNNLISVHQVAKWNDIFKLIQNRFQCSKSPIISNFIKHNTCAVCLKSIIFCMGDFVLFPCSHFFHESCLKGNSDKSRLFCHLCNDS